MSLKRFHLGIVLSYISVCGSVYSFSSSHSYATENGLLAYPVGVNSIMAGAMPGPGETWWQNYTVYYTAGAFTDGQGNPGVPGFNVNVAVSAQRFFHGWDAQLGPFNLGSAIVVPILNTDLSTLYGGQSNFGVGDIVLQPLYLGWATADHSLFGYFGVDFYIPSGGKISNNYFTVSPNATFTWFPTPKVEVSGAAGVEFHAKNEDTDYQSGAVLYVDYGVNYHIIDSLPDFAVGVGGYLIKQLSDDEKFGITYLGGFRQQGFSIGPQIMYGNRNGGIALKWQHEFATENRAEGDRFWFQFLLPLRVP